MIQLTGSQNITSVGNVGAASPTISINGIGSGFTAQQIQSLGNISPITFQFQDPNVKRYEIVESKQDLIALSVCWKRLRDTGTAGFITSMLDDSLFSSVTQDDIDQADQIRKHYQNKITVLALKNIELSSFRKDLKELVYSDGKKFKESFVPLAYRLPEFFDYDIQFEELVFSNNRELKNFKESEPSRQSIMLTPIRQFDVNKKRGKHREYWFSDSHGNLVSYYIEKSNPLLTLMDREFTKVLHITARLRKRDRDGYEYIKMFDVDFG